MGISHRQHRKYPGNPTKLKEGWRRKYHLLSWILLLSMVEVIITLNREVKIELTEKVKKTNLSKDARA